ncbi:MAG: GDSL-type esterase/lipase family protein [Flavobacterium sp.]|nr:GDSL-type esterase/lipase family protein [Flavobacterium sp.]
MKTQNIYSTLLILLFTPLMLVAQSTGTNYVTQGRCQILDNKQVLLVGSASSISYNIEGKDFAVFLESQDSWEHHNYLAIEIDGQYTARLRIEKGPAKMYVIPVSGTGAQHQIVLYKATEAANGNILVGEVKAKLLPLTKKKKKKIEFIGDSITCGMGNDSQAIPCGTGEWFDQHNAYFAYGPVLARTLNCDYLLSSVSGIGMYRNWNDEHQNEAIMPDVYEKLMLKKGDDIAYDFNFQPDLISICLGTNDFSNGDGKKERLPFNDEKYIKNYINFINTVYSHSPNARIVLLNSPMVSGDRNVKLVDNLKKVIAAFADDKKHRPIALFEFQPMQPNGCGSHPDIVDDQVMASEMETFFKKILDEI